MKFNCHDHYYSISLQLNSLFFAPQQKYEVMRTEDIPNLENSSFDPNEVLDIAQNIMSFIKRQAAVEGHTYWLYKSKFFCLFVDLLFYFLNVFVLV